MNKSITIKPGMLGRYDDVSPFVIAEDLRLDFKGLNAANGDYYVIAKLNSKEQKFKLNQEKSITLEQVFFEAGELSITVLLYLHGKKLAEYLVEPLAVKEAKTDLNAEPVIAMLMARIELLDQELETTKQTLTGQSNSLQSELNALAAILTELTKRVELLEGGFDPLQV